MNSASAAMRARRRRSRGNRLLLAVCGALAIVTATQAQVSDAQLATAISELRADDMRRDVVTLAADSFGGRGAGYAGELRAARYASHEFAASGLQPVGDVTPSGREFLQAFTLYPRRPAVPGTILKSYNTLGFRPGSDPKLSREIVVIGAHHDGQGQIGEADPGRSPRLPGSPRHTIWNSADDNATGMATVLAIARGLHRSALPTRRSILFMTFGSEEHGLVGSLHYVAHPAYPWHDHVAMLTFEQMGREPQLDPIVMGAGTSPVWEQLLTRANELTGMHVTVLTPLLIQDTDHYGFGVRGVPALAMGVEVSPDAHRPSDTSDKIDFERLAERARYALAVLVWLADMPERPSFAGVPPCTGSNIDLYLAERCSTGQDPGLSAAVLSVSERAAARLRNGTAALKVLAVVSGLPAGRAGLQAGDVIAAIDGHTLPRDVSPWSVHKALVLAPDASVRLGVKRGLISRDVVIVTEPAR